jgi:hypothetical protein
MERQQTPPEAKEPDSATSTPKTEENAPAGFPEQEAGHELTCSNEFSGEAINQAASCAFKAMFDACKVPKALLKTTKIDKLSITP